MRVKKRVEDWLDLAGIMLADIERMLQRAANEPEAHKDPKLIHAICGGGKIIADAVAGWRWSDSGRNSGGDAPGVATTAAAEDGAPSALRLAACG
jgi:hypothetical protein